MAERHRSVDVVLALVLTVAGLAEAVLGLTGSPEPWYVVLTVPLATLPVIAAVLDPNRAGGTASSPRPWAASGVDGVRPSGRTDREQPCWS